MVWRPQGSTLFPYTTLFRSEDRGELLAPDRVLLSPAAAETLGLAKGDVLHLVHGQQTIGLKVAGIAGSLRGIRSEEHTSELQSRLHLVCRLLPEKKKI